MSGFKWRTIVAMIALVLAWPVHAEMSEINVAQQYGIGYLPLMIMEDQKLMEVLHFREVEERTSGVAFMNLLTGLGMPGIW